MTSLGNVSVVIMAVAASRNPLAVAPRQPSTAGIPSASFSRGRKRPMTPVEQTSTSSSAHPQRTGDLRRHPAHIVVAALPRARVGVARVDEDGPGGRPRQASAQDFTGAPQTRLVVNTPAAVAGPSATKRARSSLVGSFLIPQWMPAARNPAGRTQEPASPIFKFIAAVRSFRGIRSSS